MEANAMAHIAENERKSWWILLLRGIAAIVFGVLAFALPGGTILALTMILGLWIMADGVIEIGYAFSTHHWWRILLGLIGLAAGIFTVAVPELGGFLLILSIAAWMIVHGVLDIVEAVRLRKQLAHEWVLILGGLASIVLGVVLAAFPGIAGMMIVGLLGAYAIIYGGLTIVEAFRMRAADRSSAQSTQHVHAA